jgi:phosphoribosyl 1,2-cyclic phosphodiesterase
MWRGSSAWRANAGCSTGNEQEECVRRINLDHIRFLGTAGSRFVVARQTRSSGGVLLQAAGERVLIDPGPGALVRLSEIRPPVEASSLSAVFLTHGHIDHANDVNIMVDAMTSGGFKKQGRLFAPGDCLEGETSVVLKYVRQFLEEIVVLEPEKEYALGRLRFRTSARLLHGAETYGFLFDIDGRRLSFLSDTRFFPGLLSSYRGSDVLVVNVVRDIPFEDNGILHLSLEDVKAILDGLRPRTAILTHFGVKMLQAGPEEQAQRLGRELGLEVLAAWDGMTYPLHESDRSDQILKNR